MTTSTRPHTTPDLPTLKPGIQLLDNDSDTSQAIHALTVDHTLLSGGDAYWIGTGTHAQSTPFVELAPSDRILDRIHLARGFTSFQHLALLQSVPECVTDRTELIVVPELDGYYRDNDLLAEEGADMLLSGIAVLAKVARDHDIPVLVTRTTADEFSQPVETAASRVLACHSTPFGPRFQGEDQDDETLVYPMEGGRVIQTTLAFWERVLAARTPLYEDAPREVTVCGTN